VEVVADLPDEDPLYWIGKQTVDMILSASV
jgi:hypothetical protein